MLFVACCLLLCVDCGLLEMMCRLWRAGCCFGAYCLLFVVCCWLCAVSNYVLFVGCCELGVACCVWDVA